MLMASSRSLALALNAPGNNFPQRSNRKRCMGKSFAGAVEQYAEITKNLLRIGTST